MIESIKLDNCGPIKKLQWENLGPINLVVGRNGTGKTFFLKILYAAVKSVEMHRRGDDPRRIEEILSEKLYWTFQEKLGDLVSKNSTGKLSCDIRMGEGSLRFAFGKDTRTTILDLEENVKPRTANSIFLPAKEILTLHRIILKSRDEDRLFGFDDTYVDLARVLANATQKGKNYKAFSKSREALHGLIGGRVEFDERDQQWSYHEGNLKFPLGLTAEGVKKIGILDILLGNRYITPESIFFIDEPEAALHPEAISRFLEIVTVLAEAGVQFFMASHSYFVIKKLHLIALEKNLLIPLVSFERDGAYTSDLREGIPPENAIVAESIKLYEEEVGVAFR